MLKKILIGVGAVLGLSIVVVVVLVATKPDAFRVERATIIKAPPEKVFALINDFKSWGTWSPWEKLDPAMKRTFSGAAAGLGTVYQWDGNSQVGQGRMEITQTTPPSKIIIKLDFLKPFEGHNTAEFSLDAAGDTTRVNWAMHGPNSFLAKIVQVFCSIDKMIGKDFEAGLANLKTVAEK